MVDLQGKKVVKFEECYIDNYLLERRFKMDRIEIAKMLREKIEENISIRLNPNERVGIYLSGGIDSNTMLS